MADEPDPRDAQWKQYELLCNFFKFYLELLLKFNVFHYAVTGAIVSFYLSRPQTSLTPLMKYSLMLPIGMSLGFGAFAFYASSVVAVARQEVVEITQALGLRAFPEFMVLKWLLILSGILLYAIAAGLIILLYNAPYS